jgi:hypothetical protein
MSKIQEQIMAEARRAFPALSDAEAVTAFMETQAGKRLYGLYVGNVATVAVQPSPLPKGVVISPRA